MARDREMIFVGVLAAAFLLVAGRSFYERANPPARAGKTAAIIAIASTGRDMSSPVSYLFGRAPFFIICDRARGTFKVVPNKYTDAQHAAGLRAAQMIAGMDIDAVCGNNIGFEPFRVFDQARIPAYTDLPATVQNTLDAFPDGLTKLTVENVPSHFGITGSKKPVACNSFDVSANLGRIVQGKFYMCFGCNYRVSDKNGAGVMPAACPKCGGAMHEVVAVASPLGAGVVTPKMKVL